MNELNLLISLLSAADKASFVAYLKKRNKRADTKNVQLFQAAAKGNYEEIKSTMTANAFNVLKKRLSDNLADYIAKKIIENEQSVPHEVMKELLLSQRLFREKAYKLAYKYLKKAEQKAQEIAGYHLLNEIYQTYIEYSYHELSPNQEELFQLYAQNKQGYDKFANLSMVYATVRKAFLTHEKGEKPIDITQLVSDSFQEFGIRKEDGYSFQSLSQIAEIIDISASYSRDYYGVDVFFENSIQQLQGSALDTEKELPFHIKLLYLVAHIYFRKKEFETSKKYLLQMQKQMERAGQKQFQLHEIKHKTLLALNENFMGNWQKAATLLDSVVSKNKLHKRDSKNLQAILARAMIYFQQQEFNQAKKLISLLWQQDKAYLDSMGVEWLLNKKFIEILIALELEDTEYADSLIKSLLRKQKIYFTGANSLALPFLKLIALFHKNPTQIKSAEFATQVENSFAWKANEEEDLFFMSYYAWLKSKMIDKPVYELTLGFLGREKRSD